MYKGIVLKSIGKFDKNLQETWPEYMFEILTEIFESSLKDIGSWPNIPPSPSLLGEFGYT